MARTARLAATGWHDLGGIDRGLLEGDRRVTIANVPERLRLNDECAAPEILQRVPGKAFLLEEGFGRKDWVVARQGAESDRTVEPRESWA